MSKRLNKRQQREQQELQELQDLAISDAAPNATSSTAGDAEEPREGVNQDESIAAPAQSTQPAQSVFAALGGDEDEGAESDEDADDGLEDASTATAATTAKPKKKNKKKKKKTPAATAAAGVEDGDGEQAGSGAVSPAPTPAVKTSKKKGGKGGGGAQASKGLSDMSLDDFDSILASQPHVVAGGGIAKTVQAAAGASSASSLRACLSLQQNHLDPDVELRRQFGSAAIKAYEAENGGAGGSGASGGARARMLARNPNLKLRSVLVQAKDTWPPVNRTFTGMVGEIEEDASTGAKVATWEHSKAYRAAQYEFQQAVATHNPEAIYALLRPYSWHVHVLSSMSDISKHQGDLGQASDWNARILFVYERTASPTFISSLTNPAGPLPVDFKKVENRGLYLAAHRMIAFLGRRGTWRTALEWSKFLFSLDEHDPHACLLWVDFLAIKSKQHRWLVEDFLPRLRKTRDLSWAGGLDFAEALGVRALEREKGDKSGESSIPLLKKAIVRHPYLLPALYAKVGLDLPRGMESHPCVQAASSQGDEEDALREIVSQIYSARNDSLWKDPELKSWLRTSVESVWTECSSGAGSGSQWKKSSLPSAAGDEATTSSLYRHILVADMPDALRQSLTSLIPHSITRETSNLDAFDPLPPRGAGSTRIDDEYFAPLIRRTGPLRGSSAATGGGAGAAAGVNAGMLERLQELLGQFQGRLPFFGGGGGGGEAPGAAGAVGEEQEAEARALMQQLLRDMPLEEGQMGAGGMPGRFDEEGEGEDEDQEEMLDSDSE
ncbi:DUF654-domain-containing protein [Microstroma glucosiphilum]|uniref:DUF654-domain-containing protein n=1 Tax=Pseudomicrostroma glucosiphilum TaxID=1684307 RepID=A0A316U131_9BASI|nr:DUF654-domain-containing protein [Pseudomicrostroma glucosiphilum]PWN18910.1 DUF654-domain-containing protein [Pseudomicrostroma glucosiphilum]